jgi:hypothetical protein
MLRRSLLIGTALVLGLAGQPSAPADLLTACAPEIGRFWADVSEGRGRLAACLASRLPDLGPACRPEVQALATARLVPGDVRRILGPGFRADLPPACERAAARYCPRVAPGDGRVFACLYARSDRVDARCSAAARALLARGQPG